MTTTIDVGTAPAPIPTERDPKPWPLFGYAPGTYQCRCVECSALFVGDKRAVMCLDCAASFANRGLAQQVLSRQQAQPTREDGWNYDMDAAPHFGEVILLDANGGRWAARWVDEEGWFEVNNHPTDSWGFDVLSPVAWQDFPAAPTSTESRE